MTGKTIRMNRLFDNGKNAVVIAIDHGFFDGPIAGMENVPELVKKINPEVDTLLLSPGMVKHCTGLFGHRNSPLMAIRINWSTVYCFDWGYNNANTVEAVSVEDAVALGADVVLISLTLKTGEEKRDAKNVELFCKLANRAHHLGIPVIGEFFPAHSDDISKEEMHNQVKIGSRVIAELGADLIKTFYTYKFKEVADGCPVPILGLGGSKTKNPVDALKLAYEEVKNGAMGVVFGRNAIQVKNPHKFQSALCDVVKNLVTPEVAAKKYSI